MTNKKNNNGKKNIIFLFFGMLIILMLGAGAINYTTIVDPDGSILELVTFGAIQDLNHSIPITIKGENGESLNNLSFNSLSKDNIGNTARNTIFSDRVVGTRIPYILVQFQYNIADYDVTYTTTGSAKVEQANSEAVLSTGTTPFSEVHMESVDSIRYQPGAEEYAIFTVAFSNGGVENVNQTIGLINVEEDGYFLGYIGQNFSIGLIDNNVTTIYDESTFIDKLDGTGKSQCNLNKSNLFIYRISLGWLGIAPIKYEVYCGDDIGWVYFAKIDLTNTRDTPTNSNPVLPINVNIVKGNSTENVTIKTASWNGGIIDGGIAEQKRSAASRFFSHSNNKSISAGVLTNIITLNSTSLFFNKTNRVETDIDFLSIATDGNKPVSIKVRRNCVLDGNQNWVRENVNNSVISYDLNGTTVSNCEEITDFQLGGTDSLTEILERLDISIMPGDTLSFLALSSQANIVTISVRWEELF